MSDRPFVSNWWIEHFNYKLLVHRIQRRLCLLHRVSNLFPGFAIAIPTSVTRALQINPERATEIVGCPFQSSLPGRPAYRLECCPLLHDLAKASHPKRACHRKGCAVRAQFRGAVDEEKQFFVLVLSQIDYEIRSTILLI